MALSTTSFNTVLDNDHNAKIMTERPPPSEPAASAANSSASSSNTPVHQPTSDAASTSLSTHLPSNPYSGHAALNGSRSANYPGYANFATNSSMPSKFYAHSNPYLTAYASYPSQHSYSSLPTTSNAILQPLNPGDNDSKTKLGTLSRDVPPTTPLPDPKTYEHWEEALKNFFSRMKMRQSLKGLENDFLVLNSDWEQKILLGALTELIQHLKAISDRMTQRRDLGDQAIEGTKSENMGTQTNLLDERKLHNVHLVNGKSGESPSNVRPLMVFTSSITQFFSVTTYGHLFRPVLPCFNTSLPSTKITKSISQFIARSRSRNNASNRAEFLHTLAERKRKITEEATAEGSTTQEAALEQGSCARTDARTIDRDKQMKYDIAKNEDGPLTRRTKAPVPLPTTADMHMATASSTSSSTLPLMDSESQPRKRRKLTTSETLDAKVDKTEGHTKMDIDEDGELAEERAMARLLGINERVQNLEEHLAIRYVPAPPRTISARIKYLEDHLVKLETEYPPWAALHFNQPRRGWPPPPRSTPVIVPPHQRSSHPDSSIPREVSSNGPAGSQAPLQPSSSKGKGKMRTSTLHKAVMDRLEVQKAMEEMKPDPG
ncbi:hypothetical protein CPB83DRAFT_898718 [Crepidotus variabilis]|uniref:Uncharacterized protein n=1 Tax=Crepidotus variabilis TaxID=179855 RepID=A0A9P6E6G1_9AGAR|nr:hypothetical protein CPB83DRAFT_898718 [Crepidotus variabilis]